MAKTTAPATATATETKAEPRKRSGITIAQLARNTFTELVDAMLAAPVASVLAVIDAERWDTIKEVHAKATTPSLRGVKPEDVLKSVETRIAEIYAEGAKDITALTTTYAAELETLMVSKRKAKDKIAKAKEAAKEAKKAASASAK